ncbi:MAG: hypothetical protein P4L22_00885 [Candidatus Babeliales bacterium]|nr:hypothetical protein [Candidatus Babeliales bacterium]
MKKIILSLSLIFCTNIFGAKIVFDLGGVILNTTSLAAMPSIVYNLGMYNIFNYSIHNPFNHPEERIFAFEDLVYNKKDAESLWLKGQITSEEFYAKLIAASNDPKYSSFFRNESERNFLRASFKFLLPQKLCNVINITFKSYTVIKQCLLEGHEIFVLSNWDPESFPLVRKKCSRIFDLFPPDNIYISGDLNHCKPYKNIYKCLIKNNNPKDYYFIDDTEKNLEVPMEIGMNTIHHTDWKSTIKKMQELGLLRDCKPFKN